MNLSFLFLGFVFLAFSSVRPQKKERPVGAPAARAWVRVGFYLKLNPAFFGSELGLAPVVPPR